MKESEAKLSNDGYGYLHSINPRQNDKQIIIETAAFIFNNYKRPFKIVSFIVRIMICLVLYGLCSFLGFVPNLLLFLLLLLVDS